VGRQACENEFRSPAGPGFEAGQTRRWAGRLLQPEGHPAQPAAESDGNRAQDRPPGAKLDVSSKREPGHQQDQGEVGQEQ